MKNKAFNFLIILAVILGGVSVFLIKQFVEVEKRKLQSQAPTTGSQVEMAKVVVAASDIPPGKAFDPLSYKIVDVPKEVLPETALTKDTDLEGKLSAVFIPKGDMILTSKAVIPSQLPRASFMIEPGRRFVSVPVNEIITSGFVIKNGDYVDLVGNFEVTPAVLGPGQEMFGTVAAVTFLQRVKVVDIYKGEVVTGGGEQKPEGGESAGSGKRLGEGTIATFDVTPKEAELIMGAAKTAQEISLVLRRFDDETVREVDNPMHKNIIAGLMQTSRKVEQVEVAPPPPPQPARKKVL